MIPYTHPLASQTTEPSIAYISSCEFNILYNNETKKIKLKSLEHSKTNNFRFLKAKILNILKNENLNFVNNAMEITQKNSIAEIDFQSSKTHITKSIENLIENMKKGECYLANMTHLYPLKHNTNLLSSSFFFKRWFQLQATFGIWFNQKKTSLVSFSPERFLIKNKTYLATQPIKGTSPLNTEKELWGNLKEMHEHTMVVDLLRHDLNSVCLPGTVTVQNPFFLKKCKSILQMQSTIFGKISSKINLSQILCSLLPAGSITGTPKKRVCEFITQYEKQSRGYYTGIAGIIETNQDFEFALLIRSYFKGKNGIYTGVGAGITTLSIADHEFEEFILKLRSFL